MTVSGFHSVKIQANLKIFFKIHHLNKLNKIPEVLFLTCILQDRIRSPSPFPIGIACEMLELKCINVREAHRNRLQSIEVINKLVF